MNTAYSLYALAVIALAILVHRLPALDLRVAAADLWPVSDDHHEDEAAYLTEKERLRAAAAEAARHRAAGGLDRALWLWVAALAAAIAGALLGFLGPLLIETLAAPSPRNVILGPRAPMDLAAQRFGVETPLGRLAQVAGLLAGVMIGLRMMRLFIGVAVLGGLVLAGLTATNFVLGRPLLALFGG